MKILIIANNLKWKSWDTKIKMLKDWWKPEVDLDITLEHTDLKNIPWKDDVTTNGTFKLIDPQWFDKNISQPALSKGYDVVIFTVSDKDWPDKRSEGANTFNNFGITEIQAIGRENAKYNYNGVKYEGDQWFNIARHEIAHAIYRSRGVLDNTHKWWTVGNLAEVKKELAGGFISHPLVLAVRRAFNPPKTYKYFNQNEIEGLKPEVVKMLDDARGLAGVPFALNSTIRSTEKNAEVGGVSDSAHLKGLAVDIRVRTSSERFKIIQALLDVGFKRIGMGKTFIHADLDSTKAQEVIWTYE